MNVSTYGNNLIQLTRLTAFSCYLVREEDGFTLVDTGLPGSAQDIIDAAQGGEIKRIVLTHAHQDHVGSLDALAAALPGVEVIASARTARFLSGDMSLDPDEPQDKLRGSYVTPETKPTRTITDGEQVGSLRAIFSPGHTPGHTAFIDTRDHTLIAGDAYAVRGGIAVAGTLKLLFPFPALATWHKPTAVDSAKKLRDLNPSRLAVGHGKVLENPVPQMEQAIRDAKS